MMIQLRDSGRRMLLSFTVSGTGSVNIASLSAAVMILPVDTGCVEVDEEVLRAL